MEDSLGNLAEALYIMLLIRGDDHAGMPNHIEVTYHRHVVLKEAFLSMDNERLRYSCIDELRNLE